MILFYWLVATVLIACMSIPVCMLSVRLGIGIAHGLMLVFIDHDMSMKWLRNYISKNRK